MANQMGQVWQGPIKLSEFGDIPWLRGSIPGYPQVFVGYYSAGIAIYIPSMPNDANAIWYEHMRVFPRTLIKNQVLPSHDNMLPFWTALYSLTVQGEYLLDTVPWMQEAIDLMTRLWPKEDED